ncbi:MAG TPA: phosphate acetyltransferase [Polyangiales bacterium]|nr:phosphate acetyltransferase [Polyangiales bacterium]
MPPVYYLAPSGSSVGLTTIALGLVHALEERGIRVAFYKPIAQARVDDPDLSTHFIACKTSLQPPAPIPLQEAERTLSEKRGQELLEHVLSDFQQVSSAADVVIVEGLVETIESSIEDRLNLQLVKTLNAEVILVGALQDASSAALEARLRLTAEHYGGLQRGRVIGCIINRVPNPEQRSREALRQQLSAAIASIGRQGLTLLGAVTNNAELSAVRTLDVARQLHARVLNEGELKTRRVRRFTLLSGDVTNLVSALQPGSLLITESDRSDVLLAVALAALKNVPIAGLVVTGMAEIPKQVLELIAPALQAGLPLLAADAPAWETAAALLRMSPELPMDDLERARTSMVHVAEQLELEWLIKRCRAPVEVRMTPAAFYHRLVQNAARAKARVVLPEGSEPRTISAAVECTRRNIARCVLLGEPAKIKQVAQGLELTLPESLEIIDPASIRENYIAALVERRKHKGVTEHEAAELLEDNVWLGTLMLALGEVDGLVSGAVHSTANTIRPAFQIIKTKPDASIVSSVFFMCLPDQVVVYGDCAVNPDPDAAMLADIALQSADSAARFGIEPRVAMLSYSTGDSGSGADVDKVREATRLAHARRPELQLDGPMQYDAAENAEVAKAKAPGSPVAGRATVFIFPDLNTGNTTYKAVQRSANVVSVGPMLQGLNKPVNDLSRGALVEDIVYTIALTAIQSAGSGP